MDNIKDRESGSFICVKCGKFLSFTELQKMPCPMFLIACKEEYAN